jgi:hypothetical protein
VDEAVRATLAAQPSRPSGTEDPTCSRACTSELQQVQQFQSDSAAEALRACQEEPAPSGLEGWCYIDPARGIGSAELVSSCPVNEQRRLRFPGQGPAEGSNVMLVCPEARP